MAEPRHPGTGHVHSGAQRLIVALDIPGLPELEVLMRSLENVATIVKVGMELFTAAGPAAVVRAKDAGMKVFLDLKYHDIPTTVEKAVRSAGELGVSFLTLHAAGGRQMLCRAVEAAQGKVQLLGVTVLTSWGEAELAAEVGLKRSLSDQVLFWAELCRECGLDGVVSSPWEVAGIKNLCGPDFVVVTPGVRPAWAAADDQRRIMTPKQALEVGSDYLVIGRPITAARDPQMALQKTIAEMDELGDSFNEVAATRAE